MTKPPRPGDPPASAAPAVRRPGPPPRRPAPARKVLPFLPPGQEQPRVPVPA